MCRRVLWIATALLCLAPALAWGQVVPERIPTVVFDLRGFYSPLGQDPVTAANLGIAETALPGRGLGGVAALHLALVRRGKLALGLGGEALLARASRTPSVPTGSEALPGPAVHQRLEGLTAQLLVNFGTADGWSYVTAGTGPMRFGTYLGDTPPAEPSPRKSALNMGGGARWFAKPHLAFTFDVRFYLTRPEVETPDYPGRQRNRLMILSAGLSIK
jgi:hypothetical protein